MTKEQFQEAPQLENQILEKESEIFVMMLYNDDVNTFDHVISCLIDVCDHDSIQAEQCAFIVHHNGKCDVKHGSFEELKPLKQELTDRGLSVQLEKA